MAKKEEQEEFDICIIGAGSAGLSVAAGAVAKVKLNRFVAGHTAWAGPAINKPTPTANSALRTSFDTLTIPIAAYYRQNGENIVNFGHC